MKLSIGTANFLKRYGLLKTHVSNNEVLKIFRYLKKNNLKNLDTAIEYDNFLKLRNKINFDKFFISTKINFVKNNLSQKYFRILKKQIDSNKFKQYETIFIHNFDDIKKKKSSKNFRIYEFIKKT